MAEEEEFLQLKKQGELVGLSGSELLKYITDTQRDLRAERREADRQREERERQERLEKAEREERQEERERQERREERELQAQREQAQLEATHRENQAIREHELTMLEAQNKQEQNPNGDSGRNDRRKSCKLPKLPYFNEDKDDIDSFISRFEKWAQESHIDQEQWSDHLSYLLTGNALNIVQTLLKSELQFTWQQLKEELLKRYQCSASGFREKFRKSRLQKDESFVTFLSRMTHCFDRWIDLSKTDKTYAELRDLILREQFLHSVNKNLQAYLLEHSFDHVSQMADSAENYRLAHPEKNLSYKDSNGDVLSGCVASEVQNEDLCHFGNVAQQRHQFIQNAQRGFQNRSRNRNLRRGFGRGQHGFGRGSYQPLSYSPTSNSEPVSNEQQKRCFKCESLSHFIQDCPDMNNICTRCKGDGHTVKDCHIKKKHVQQAYVLSSDDSTARLYKERAVVNGFDCSLLRDTGCTTAAVKRKFVKSDQYLNQKQSCKTFSGQIEIFDLAKIDVHTPYYAGELVACVIDDPVCDLILGNLPQVSAVAAGDYGTFAPCLVATRAQTKKSTTSQSIPAPDTSMFSVSPSEFAGLQKDDSSLEQLFKAAIDDRTDDRKPYFVVKNNLLYRCSTTKNTPRHQLVVPQKLRQTVLHTAHNGLFSGHCGTKRTLLRITSSFYWPGVTKNVRLYCRSCDICQRTMPKGRIPSAPIQDMPIVSTPFERIAIDIVGPLPLTASGHRYILTIVDVATRYPDAFPLRNIDTVSVANALWEYFSRVGIPSEILSDCGTQFLSDVMQEVFRLLCISHAKTTPYHPQSNGMVERFNGTLKSMLKKVAANKPKSWDKFIPGLLFSYRELPNETLGYSPFELIYGHSPRGPVQLLFEQWSKQNPIPDEKNVCQYVLDLHNTIHDTCKLAQSTAAKNLHKHKLHANKKAKLRSFKPGTDVLVLLTDEHSKMMVRWKGPYKVVERKSRVNYVIDIDGKQKLLHVNMLKEYFHAANVSINILHDDNDVSGAIFPFSNILSPDYVPDVLKQLNSIDARDTQNDKTFDDLYHANVMVLNDKNDTNDIDVDVDKCNECDLNDNMNKDVHNDDTLPTLSVKGETYEDVKINENLTEDQKLQLKQLLYEYSDVLTDSPGFVSNVQPHKILLTDDTPIRVKPYPLPFAKKEIVQNELQVMLNLGVIEPSDSPYSFPVVLIPKPDGSVRFCIDYRKLNSVTVFDAEPIPDFEDILCQLSDSKFYIKIDLAKGYWQIPMASEDKSKTAFQTPFGLFQWTRMPFGLKNAPATFARMMRKLKLYQINAENFFDDILVHGKTFVDLLHCFRLVLDKLREFHLTARPSKVFAGFQTLQFLGHTISVGTISPEKTKVQKILALSQPKTKKQVQSLLGLLSYYRRYVPNFAQLTSPLTDLTKGGKTKQIVWTTECQTALENIQAILNNNPVLIMPVLQKPFVLRTDASATGMGATLFQEKDSLLHPVQYASKKFSDAQVRYSTVERECLAIVWACDKFAKFLIGKEFILQTDHRPLIFLKSSRSKNSRLLRWSLQLQEYNFDVKPVSGKDNTLADLLSRQ